MLGCEGDPIGKTKDELRSLHSGETATGFSRRGPDRRLPSLARTGFRTRFGDGPCCFASGRVSGLPMEVSTAGAVCAPRGFGRGSRRKIAADGVCAANRLQFAAGVSSRDELGRRPLCDAGRAAPRGQGAVAVGQQYRTIAWLLGAAGALDVRGCTPVLEVNLHRTTFLRSREGRSLAGGRCHSSGGPVARAYIRDGSA